MQHICCIRNIRYMHVKYFNAHVDREICYYVVSLAKKSKSKECVDAI